MSRKLRKNLVVLTGPKGISINSSMSTKTRNWFIVLIVGILILLIMDINIDTTVNTVNSVEAPDDAPVEVSTVCPVTVTM